MHDASRRGGRRNAPANARAARRSDPYARDSRARVGAAAREEYAVQPVQSPASMSSTAPELSIRGTSGPTWIVISNLAAGTSTEDVRLTFGMFGRVEEVRLRPPPSATHPTVAFEVAFDRREDAESAAAKFNGALADGRILSVTIRRPDVSREPYSQFSRAPAPAVEQRPRRKADHLIPAPAALPYTPSPAAAVTAAIPTGPASMRSRANTARLVEPRAKQSNGAASAHKKADAGGKATAVAASNVPGKNKSAKATNAAADSTTGKKATAMAATKPQSLAQRIPEPLVNRLLTPEQAKKLREEEAKKKARDEARAKAIAATGKHTVLGKRLGGLPLAQRLVRQAGTPQSDQSAIQAAADKKKRKRELAKAKKARKAAAQPSGMDLDG